MPGIYVEFKGDCECSHLGIGMEFLVERGFEKRLDMGSAEELSRGVMRACSAGGTARKEAWRKGSVGNSEEPGQGKLEGLEGAE